MRLLYLTDRLSDRGGADHHLLQVVMWAVGAGHRVTVAFGSNDLPPESLRGVTCHRLKGLASRIDTASGLGSLTNLLEGTDLAHLHNVMNPTAIARSVQLGPAVATIQDHRFFCPGPGKTLPDGSPCRSAMSDELCRVCLPDEPYRRSTLDLTRRRLAAIDGAHLVVLSRYMARELEAVGRPGAMILPPWVAVGPPPVDPGQGFVIGGRLVPHKAVDDAWSAWIRAGRPHRLLVAGEGSCAEDLPGAEQRGWLGREELAGVLRGARALLFPARWQEPFGMLGVEALAQGTPVVVADAGGTSEWSSTGCLRVAAGDRSAMAGAIARLAAEPDTALDLGRAGQASVARAFDRDRIEQRLQRLYHRAAIY